MEVIGYGFLLGIGILLAALAFCAVVGIFLLLILFVNYLTEKGKDRQPAPVENAEYTAEL